MINRILLIFTFAFLVQTVHSEHLVGGVISYRHVTGNTYQVTLKVYRDCFSDGAPFDSPSSGNGSAVIGIFTGDNQLHSSFVMGFPDVNFIDPALSGLCEDVEVPACVQEGVYIQTVNLPPNETGYTLVYQRCCRNGTILNILSPGDTGNTYTAFIPPGDLVEDNSCPTFDNFPPVGLCLNSNVVFDHAATDEDGDSLVYSFCNPFAGASTFDPQPDLPSNPEYQEVVWAAGYSTEYQIAADPAFNIDPNTGLLTGTPNQQGQFVMGICVQEFRDGAFISEVRRDFQFNVVMCPDQPIANFDEFTSSVDCNNEITFENNSEDGDSYLWDFGDGNSSTEFNPTHSYDEGGTYEVALTVFSGNCSDTQLTEVTLLGAPDPEFEEPEFQCLSGAETYALEVTNVSDDGITYEWQVEGQAPVVTATNELTNLQFVTPGDYNVVVTAADQNGCVGEDETFITVNPPVVADFEVDDGFCTGINRSFTNTSTGSDNVYWDFDFDFSADPTGQDIVEVTFPDVGNYYVELVASGAAVCNDTTYQLVVVSELPFVSAEMPEPQCHEGNSSSFVPSGNFATPATFSWNIGDAVPFTSNATSLSNISVLDAGDHSFELSVIDANGCDLTFEDSFETIAPLEVSFSTQGTGCLPYTAYFNNTSTGGSSVLYEWDFGDGQTSISSFPSHFYEVPGTFTISLTASSTHGCIESQTYTLPNAITTFPSPSVGFEVTPKNVTIIDPNISVTSTVDSVACEFFISDASYYSDCDFSHAFDDAGTCEVTQEVTNNFDCTSKLTRIVEVTGHLFFAPNAITLNEDGLNDFWKPKVIGDIVDYNLEIYSRDGQVIFQTNDFNKAWRPEYSHDGQYNFVATVRDRNSTPVVYSGSFISLR